MKNARMIRIFNLTIIKTEDYEKEITQLKEDYDRLHTQLYRKYEADVKHVIEEIQYKEKEKLSKIRKLVKNNKEILTELEKWLKNPNMFDTGEDYKNYAEAYLKLKQDTIDFIK